MPGSYFPYARVSSGLVTTTLDAVAKNQVGGLWAPPVPYPTTGTFSTTAGASTAGLGAAPVFRYVYFNDINTLTGTAQVAPAPVYYIDESFTTVTPNAANAYFTTLGACIAGYWMPNTTALGTSQTAAQWYSQMIGSYGWMQVGGFLSGALAPSTTTSAGQGNPIYGATTGSWTSIVNNASGAGSANIWRFLAVQWTAIANGVCDVVVAGDSPFWGS
jgi:hypothetical protein